MSDEQIESHEDMFFIPRIGDRVTLMQPVGEKDSMGGVVSCVAWESGVQTAWIVLLGEGEAEGQ